MHNARAKQIPCLYYWIHDAGRTWIDMIYFKHQSNMRHDIKLKRVIARYGLEGYGLYNLILESITESLSTDSPLPDLQEDCEDIAEFYNANTAKINEIMNFMINQGLFDLDEITGHVMCAKLYKFLDTSQTRSEKLREMIREYKNQINPLEIENNQVSQIVSDISERKEKKRRRKEEETEEETEEEESVKKHKHGEFKNVLLSEKEYSNLFKDWGAKETEKMIKELDEGIEMKGYKYKSHNLAIRKWKNNKQTKKIDTFKAGGINVEL